MLTYLSINRTVTRDSSVRGLNCDVTPFPDLSCAVLPCQCRRELRTFFRAALSELHKEKRCTAFWRPVDPEMVPDYYDVIRAPMDLETMRMKVSMPMPPEPLLDMRNSPCAGVDPST